MHSSTSLLAALLLPAAFALPSHEHGKAHQGHGPYKSGAVSGAPIASATGGAPYGHHNATAAAGTGDGIGAHHSLKHKTISIDKTIYRAGAGAPEQAAATGAANAGAESRAGSPANAAAEGGNEKLACAAVTVTLTPTVTVTVYGGGAPAGSADASAVPVSSPAQIPTQAPIPANAASSATAVPVETASAAPVGQAPSSTSKATKESTSAKAGNAGNAGSSAAAAPVEAASTSPTGKAAAPANTAASTNEGTTAPANAASAGTKRGVLIPAGGADQKALVSLVNSSPKITWCANWYSSAPPDLAGGKEFVPQNYGLESDKDGTWTKNAQKAAGAGTKHFLSFGEPNTPNAKLQQTAAGAAAFWMKEMQPYTDKVTIGAPGILQNKQDFGWLSEFLTECDKLGCKIGFIALHWFYKAEAGNVAGFKDVINNATSIAKGKPVWLDNFQATGSDAAQKEFLGEVVPWLESNAAVERYAYVFPDGSVGSMGQYYASL